MLDQLMPGKRSWLSGVLEYPFGRGMNFQIDTTDVTGLYKRAQDSGEKIILELEEKWYRSGNYLLVVGNLLFLILTDLCCDFLNIWAKGQLSSLAL